MNIAEPLDAKVDDRRSHDRQAHVGQAHVRQADDRQADVRQADDRQADDRPDRGEQPRETIGAVPDDVFSLPARDFIEAWAAALGLSGDDLSAWDREDLAGAIRRGTSRLKVIDALRSRTTAPVKPIWSPRHDIRRPPDRLTVLESLVRFAPDDDTAFLRYAFERICDRAPTPVERLELEFDLRSGRSDRGATIRRITAIAQREGHFALWDSLQPEAEPRDPTDARAMPAGLMVDEDGEQTFIFARQMPDGRGWLVGPDMMRQDIKIKDGGWAVHEGWLIVGPKRSFRPGLWRLDIDLVQAADAVIDIDVVANSGLDVLQRLAVFGPFSGSVGVAIEHDHRFVEFRLHVRPGQGRSWLKPRNISMRRVS